MSSYLSSGEYSGVLSVLVGLIVVVLTGVGLSVVMDMDLATLVASTDRDRISANNELSRQIIQQENKIRICLKNQIIAKKHREMHQILGGLEKQNAAVFEEMALLKDLISKDQASIKLLDQGKEIHRSQYKEYIRASAVGDVHDQVITRLGKKYTKVKIIEVTPLGVAISHSTGTARLGYRDMPDVWRNKFMFTAGEVASARLEETKRLTIAQNRWAKNAQNARKLKLSASRLREVSSLRQQVAVMKMKASSAQMEALIARNKASSRQNQNSESSQSRSYSSYRYYNSSTGSYSRYRPRYRIRLNSSRMSVSGSLETWGRRAVRYERLAADYAVKLARLQARLSLLDPSYDPEPQSSKHSN